MTPEGSEGESGAAHLITLIHIAMALQQHFQSLRVAVVRLQHTQSHTLSSRTRYTTYSIQPNHCKTATFEPNLFHTDTHNLVFEVLSKVANAKFEHEF